MAYRPTMLHRGLAGVTFLPNGGDEPSISSVTYDSWDGVPVLVVYGKNLWAPEKVVINNVGYYGWIYGPQQGVMTVVPLAVLAASEVLKSWRAPNAQITIFVRNPDGVENYTTASLAGAGIPPAPGRYRASMPGQRLAGAAAGGIRPARAGFARRGR